MLTLFSQAIPIISLFLDPITQHIYHCALTPCGWSSRITRRWHRTVWSSPSFFLSDLISTKTDQRWCKMSKTVTGSHYIEVSSSSQVKMCCYQFILFCHLYMKLSFSKCVHIFLSSISPYISWWRKLHVIYNFKS